MWFRPLAAFILLSSVVLAQDDDFTKPGEPALQYTDGAFIEPRGSQSTYSLGATLNVSWHTTYDTSNLWLIVGWDFNEPIQLATNIGQTWYEWQVSTDSTNKTEIYSFRVVDATGTTEQQNGGGFLSAAFYIGNLKTTSSVSTSASATAATTEASVTSSSSGATQTTDSAVGPTSGLSEGGKIGVGVGVALGVVGIIALIAGILLYRRSKNSKTQAADGLEPFSQTPQTYISTPGSQLYNEYYKPAIGPSEMENTAITSELPGYSYADNQGAHRVELQG
ncbi:hypothetical protein F4818DRAFT_17953 [Hypoxylon cercidicola]|nr:hypothetical protein F4818DRAFT_17953 [Hypoxylon cercidicola]